MRSEAFGKGESVQVDHLSSVNLTSSRKGFDENIKVIGQAI